MLEVEVSVDHLAEFIFTKNVNNAIIDLSLEGLQNAKDFFFFCLDLFCKGLVYMFGNGSIVHVQDISQENFTQLRNKLKLAGIDAILEITPPDIDVRPGELRTNINELNTYSPDDASLDQYKFILKSCDFTYIIHFQLVHNVTRDCNDRPAAT